MLLTLPIALLLFSGRNNVVADLASECAALQHPHRFINGVCYANIPHSFSAYSKGHKFMPMDTCPDLGGSLGRGRMVTTRDLSVLKRLACEMPSYKYSYATKALVQNDYATAVAVLRLETWTYEKNTDYEGFYTVWPAEEGTWYITLHKWPSNVNETIWGLTPFHYKTSTGNYYKCGDDGTHPCQPSPCGPNQICVPDPSFTTYQCFTPMCTKFPDRSLHRAESYVGYVTQTGEQYFAYGCHSFFFMVNVPPNTFRYTVKCIGPEKWEHIYKCERPCPALSVRWNQYVKVRYGPLQSAGVGLADYEPPGQLGVIECQKGYVPPASGENRSDFKDVRLCDPTPEEQLVKKELYQLTWRNWNKTGVELWCEQSCIAHALERRHWKTNETLYMLKVSYSQPPLPLGDSQGETRYRLGTLASVECSHGSFENRPLGPIVRKCEKGHPVARWDRSLWPATCVTTTTSVHLFYVISFVVFFLAAFVATN